MKKRREKRINNKGFTLVELLIAVAIIAIIVTPILDGIVTSMKVNKKSDEMLKETAIADSIMESMTNMSLADIAVKLSGAHSSMDDFLSTEQVDASGNVTLGMYNSDSAKQEILTTVPGGAAATACVTETDNGDGTYSYDFTPNATGVYTFGLKNIEYDGKDYDVRVTLDSTNEHTKEYNEAEYVDLSEFDDRYDALYSQASDVDAQICGELAVDSTTMGKTLTADDIDSKASRIFKIKIYTKTEKDIHLNDHTYTIVETEYGREVDASVVASGAKTYASQKYEFYSNKEDESNQLRNLYIMFDPNYNSNFLNGCKDEIIIENEENIPVTIYLIKQGDPTASISSKEGTYLMEITSIYKDSTGVNPTKIRTNLGYDLEALLDGKGWINENKIETQCKITVENKYSNTQQVFSGNKFYDAVEKITGASNERVRVFTKKVEVFSAGEYAKGFTGTPLTTLNSESRPTPTP